MSDHAFNPGLGRTGLTHARDLAIRFLTSISIPLSGC